MPEESCGLNVSFEIFFTKNIALVKTYTVLLFTTHSLLALVIEKWQETFPFNDLLKQKYNVKQTAGSCKQGIRSVRTVLDTQTWDQIHEHAACDSDARLVGNSPLQGIILKCLC
jgi:hypothetical protein